MDDCSDILFYFLCDDHYDLSGGNKSVTDCCYNIFKPLSFFECLPYEIVIAAIISLPETIISLKLE